MFTNDTNKTYYLGRWYLTFTLDSSKKAASLSCEKVEGDANNYQIIRISSRLPTTIREVSGTYQLASEKITVVISGKSMTSGQGYILNTCSYDFSTLTADTNSATLHLSPLVSKAASSISQSHHIWPNPASTVININNLDTDRGDIQLIDVFGRTIPIQIIIVDGEAQLDVRSLSQGCYFIKINNEIEKVIIE